MLRLGNTNEAHNILDRRTELLSDVKYIYNKSDTLEKREFIDMVFDSNLHYENGIYQTPTTQDFLIH